MPYAKSLDAEFLHWEFKVREFIVIGLGLLMRGFWFGRLNRVRMFLFAYRLPQNWANAEMELFHRMPIWMDVSAFRLVHSVNNSVDNSLGNSDSSVGVRVSFVCMIRTRVVDRLTKSTMRQRPSTSVASS